MDSVLSKTQGHNKSSGSVPSEVMRCEDLKIERNPDLFVVFHDIYISNSRDHDSSGSSGIHF